MPTDPHPPPFWRAVTSMLTLPRISGLSKSAIDTVWVPAAAKTTENEVDPLGLNAICAGACGDRRKKRPFGSDKPASVDGASYITSTLLDWSEKGTPSTKTGPAISRRARLVRVVREADGRRTGPRNLRCACPARYSARLFAQSPESSKRSLLCALKLSVKRRT